MFAGGDIYAHAVRWECVSDRRLWRAELHDGSELLVQFHKRGGRGSAGEGRSFWSFCVYAGELGNLAYVTEFKSASDAKQAAVAEYNRLFAWAKGKR